MIVFLVFDLYSVYFTHFQIVVIKLDENWSMVSKKKLFVNNFDLGVSKTSTPYGSISKKMAVREKN